MNSSSPASLIQQNYKHMPGQSCVCVQRTKEKEKGKSPTNRKATEPGNQREPRGQGTQKKQKNRKAEKERKRPDKPQSARDQGHKGKTGNPGNQKTKSQKGHKTHTHTHTTAQKDYQGRDFLIVIFCCTTRSSLVVLAN